MPGDKQTVLDFPEGVRITADGSGVLIEVTDYHAEPVRLTRDHLARLGFVPSAESAPEPGRRERPSKRP